jgi:hypothetical protein
LSENVGDAFYLRDCWHVSFRHQDESRTAGVCLTLRYLDDRVNDQSDLVATAGIILSERIDTHSFPPSIRGKVGLTSNP